MKMIIPLAALQPNPFRDFRVDPIDGPENDNDEIGYVSAVTKLRESIEEDGFWGGVVVRKHGSQYQIAAGHHRVEAAKLAGMTEADLVVLPMDDDAMIRVYARENATQRGQSSSAMAGSVAAALRKALKDGALIAGEVTSNTPGNFTQPIGRPAILQILGNVPGITDNSVKEQIALLKSSGDYTRIAGEVADEVHAEQERLQAEAKAAEAARVAAEEASAKAKAEREAREQAVKEAKEAQAKRDAELAAKRAREQEIKAQQAALEAQKRAEIDRRMAEAATTASTKADAVAQKAKDDPKLSQSFDYKGVSKWLRIDNQIRAFRKWATGEGIKPYLPVEAQALVAEALVKHAAENDLELSAAYITSRATEMLFNAKRQAPKQQKELKVKAWQDKVDHWVDNFSRGCRTMTGSGAELAALFANRPPQAVVRVPNRLKTEIREARDTLEALYKSLYGE